MMDTYPNAQSSATRPTRRSVTTWLVYVVAGLAALTSAVFGLLSLFAPVAFLSLVGVQTQSLTADAQVFAAYLGARELAIAGALLVLLVMRRLGGVAAVLLLAGLANAFDVMHALTTQQWAQLPGALVSALIYLAAAFWLFKRSARNKAVS